MTAPAGILIGELARLSGVTAETIRYYERERIIPRPRRSGNGKYRRYDAGEADRLRFVRRARDLGFSLEDIRGLLVLAETGAGRPCRDLEGIVRTHLASIDEKLAQLTALKSELRRLTSECNPNGRIAECTLITALNGHNANR
jgi:DNA-binding transcriptional MerR regulator